ncbi:phosphate ABC transporter substrate-binding protein PstS family protein [Youngiibacter multivorans]|uniref:Phosphate-binding protein n=1 Tax=Youngiibacter multivorans TaxID=937251 RepID=A0ABS4G700_9CLOT|nr:phosphate ABC transporter substrate-binding protein PstS family protein [Youngiibacter multivorans]MBP1920222.1 phosphate transport system substrate-binding protein [Youngiibacter multivorans]
MNKKILGLVSSLALVSVLAGCGATATPTTAPSATEPKLSGAVIVDGSGTVYPLMANIAENYMTDVQDEVSVQVGRAGSSAGLKKFIAGELDFADASRKIKDTEVAELVAAGKKMDANIMEIKLAYDGLTLVINKENTWATEMKAEEILNMYTSGKIKSDDKVLWSDIRSTWPAEEVKFYGPNENHGTYEFFYEGLLKKENLVSTVNLQQEYSTLVDLVSKDKNAIAFFGYGYYESNMDKLNAVKVDFGSGAVEPKLETIGEALPYAGFTRLVYTYLDLDKAKANPQVLDYAKFVVSADGAAKLAGENGFAPLPDSVYSGYAATLDAVK